MTTAALPHGLAKPATASIPLILKISDSPHRPPAFLHGAHGRYTIMDGACAPMYVQVWLAPLGAYQVLGCPIRDLGGAVIELEAVFGADGRHVLEAVREEPTWRGRFALIDAFLLRAAERGPRPAPEVAAAWQLLTVGGGMIPVRLVADEVGWSHKRLIDRFTEQVGLTPKKVARLARFYRLLARVRAGRLPATWSQAAVECGYADQPHMIREFRVFTGTTPAEFLSGTSA
jgi:AraC-like DNA-binding protein